MKASVYDTIVAIATPPGEGGIGVIRVSGERAEAMGKKFFKKAEGGDFGEFQPRKAYLGRVIDRSGRELDRGIGIFFKAPASYTGEDVFEFQLHGSPLLLKKILDEILDEGVRLAEPGEFTKRAFLNGKIDLIQAEAVIDLIESYSEKALENAVKVLEGEFSKKLWEVRKDLKEVLLHLEAAIDFPEEDLELEDYPELIKRVNGQVNLLSRLLESYIPGRIFQYGLSVVIAGMPNVGKSKLLNRLLKRERAIVSEVPGTTRDFIEERTLIAGIPLRLTDTAGLRKTGDPVEKIGIDITKKKIDESDLVIFIFDLTREPEEEEFRTCEKIPAQKRIIVANKLDIEKKGLIKKIRSRCGDVAPISALTGEGVDELEKEIRMRIQVLSSKVSSEIMLTSERQYRLIREALSALRRALEEMKKNSPAEFVALEVRAALERIGELTGEFYSEELLEEIFTRFCIGK